VTRRRCVALALAALAISGCSALLTFDGFGDCRDGACVSFEPEGGDAGSEGSEAVDAQAICTPRKWPGPPDADTTLGSTTLVYALKELRFGVDADAGAGASTFDINNRCVCPGGIQGKGSCAKDAAPTCDGPTNGADNAFAELFKSFALFDNVFISDREATNAVARGDFSILVRIDDYRATPNQGRVTTSIYNALRVDRDGGGVPTFTPDERWVVDRTFLFDPPSVAPKFVDSKAYVANGTLVAFFPQLEFVVVLPRLGRTRFKATDTRLVLPLPTSGGAAQGQLLGRIAISSIVEVGGILGWCPGTPQFLAIAEACKRADVNGAADDKGEAPCDALSTAMELTFVPTQRPQTIEVGTYSASTCPTSRCP
jgi:hypothetical protein